MDDLEREKRDREKKDRRNLRCRELRVEKSVDERRATANTLVENAKVEAMKIKADAEQEALVIITRAEEKAMSLQDVIRAREVLLQSIEERLSHSIAMDEQQTHLQDENNGSRRGKRKRSTNSGHDELLGSASGHVGPNRSKRRAQAVATQMVELFASQTKAYNFESKKEVLKLFWLHRTLTDVQPSVFGKPRIDQMLSAGMTDMKAAFKKVKHAKRKDHLAAKHSILVAMVGREVTANRACASLAKVIGIKRDHLYKAKQKRMLIDEDSLIRFPMGERKVRSDKLSIEVRDLVQLYWETRTRVSPNKKDEARRRISRNVYETHRVHWLDDTEVEFFLCFQQWNESEEGKKITIGLRSFQYLKPYYVRTLKDRNVCCCKQHVQMDLLKGALNKFRVHSHPNSMECDCTCGLCNPVGQDPPTQSTSSVCVASKSTITSVREWCEQMLCPKLEGDVWHKKSCLASECWRCGPRNLLVCPQEVNSDPSVILTWDTYENVALDDIYSGKSKEKRAKGDNEDRNSGPGKRLTIVHKRTNPREFIEHVKETMPSFIMHNFRARWQAEQYKKCLALFPRGTVVSAIDFAENYTFKVQNEVQSLHWVNKQVTILVHVTYRHKEDIIGNTEPESADRNIIADYQFYISDDNAHDTLYVQHCLDLHAKWMQSESIFLNQHWVWSDGCAAQFKACRPFYFVSRYYSTYGVRMTWNFHASGHGKDVPDGLGGTIKSAVEREQLKENGYMLENAHDVVEFCAQKFALGKEKEYGGIQEVRRIFWEIGVTDVDKKKKWDCESIKGIRILHCFDGFSSDMPTLLKCREFSCFCPYCLDGNSDECSNLEHTGEWELKNIHPMTGADVTQFVLQLGVGQGGNEWDQVSLADMLEVGDYFAVDAKQPNNWNAEFFIVECAKLQQVVVEAFTDDYSESFEEGDMAIECMWFQQYGRQETFFVLANKRCFVHPRSIIHIKFALQPTGILRRSKSFTIAPDTLASIMSSQRLYNPIF